MTNREVMLARLNTSPEECHFCGGPLVEDYLTHHLDEDRDNNASENLVWAHRGCHSRHHNSGRLRSDNTTGFAGVRYRKGRGIYIARKVIDGKRCYLGSAKTPEGAAALLEGALD